MCDDLFVGMTIYHKTDKTKAVIIGIDKKNIIIKLSKKLALKEKLTLPIIHIGEWLFFDESDVGLGVSILANRPEYLKYKNPKVLDAYNNIAEEREKTLELYEQMTAEIQKQRKIEEKIKCETRLKTEFNNFLKIGTEDNRIEEIIKKRKIPYLVHFTRIDNLNSILKNGLVPVCLQQKKNILSIHNDDRRIDAQLDCTSCSVGFPNYKLFYTFRELKYPGTMWVTIVINTDILFSPTNIKYYCYTNAAAVFPKIKNVKELCTATSFEKMFCELITQKENKIINRSSLQIDDYYTTDPQAEILISDIIEPKYIKGICFQKQNDIEYFIKNNGAKLISQYQYRIFTNYFDARKDYMYWKKE